jgi:dTDP-4-amino-4,6-dideoxygalactose transaminase
MFWVLLSLPFKDKLKLRNSFHGNFSNIFYGNAAFSYSSGRASLYACLKAGGINKGDEVILSSFTCLAVPTAIVALGAVPKYCDINASSLNCDLDFLKKTITERTKAIVVQHTLGSPACVGEIKKFVEGKDIMIIEDCALSMGSTKGGTLLGTEGDASIFSLELSKTISSGWGGVLLVNNKELEASVSRDYQLIGEISFYKSFRMALQVLLSGILYLPTIYPIGKYFIAFLFKSRLFKPSSPVCEEIGVRENDFICKLPKTLLPLADAQISRFNEIKLKHQAHSLKIRLMLEGLNFSILGDYSKKDDSVSPRVPFLVRDRECFLEFFYKRGIEVGSWFNGPLSPTPKNIIFNYDSKDFPNASFVARHIVNIPCHARLSSDDLILIEKTLSQFSEKFPNDIGFQEITLFSSS